MPTTKFESFFFNIHTIQQFHFYNLTIRTYFILNIMPYNLGDTPEGRYKPCLVKLMNFIVDNPDLPLPEIHHSQWNNWIMDDTGDTYTDENTFTTAQLIRIKHMGRQKIPVQIQNASMPAHAISYIWRNRYHSLCPASAEQWLGNTNSAVAILPSLGKWTMWSRRR